MKLDLDPRQRAMLQEMGVHVWAPRTLSEPVPQRPAALVKRTAHRPEPRQTAPSPAAMVTGVADNLSTADWSALAQSVAVCQACPLCLGRQMPVLGGTARQADWLIVGEPVDEAQELARQPFTGAAGQLLDNMLKAVQVSCHGEPLARSKAAYVTNVVKCRPAAPRNPALQELAICENYLRRQVALVQPKIILALGHFAAQSLLQASHPELVNSPLGQLRGAVYQYQQVPLLVTYPPSYLLRSPQHKARVWEDLCLAKSLLQTP